LKVKVMPVVVEMGPVARYTLLPRNVVLMLRPSVSGFVDERPYAVLNAPPLLKMASYAVVTAESSPDVQGAALVGVQKNPVAVPVGEKPVIVLVAPTLPTTTEVPVFETLPPRSPKELAAAGISKIGAPKAGITATNRGKSNEQST
jgi:hypothetical protein